MKVFIIFLSIFAITFGNIPRISERIIGGHSTTIEEHPYQVSLQYRGKHHCGGSIISENAILTAAHCVRGFSLPTTNDCHRVYQDIIVKVGSTYLNSGQEYEIAEIIVHPEFSKGSKNDNNIAVLKLAKPLTFCDKVQPIELQPADCPVPVGATVLATGWGGMLNSPLQEVDLVIAPNEKCQRFFKSKITSTMLCTHSSGKGTYKGDGGGPLVYKNRLIGVTSHGIANRTDFPFIFARVSVLNKYITNCL